MVSWMNDRSSVGISNLENRALATGLASELSVELSLELASELSVFWTLTASFSSGIPDPHR